jgi:hypothetical protein
MKHKQKTHKRKTHKRKTHKRKTHKRKTHKLKTHKLKTHKLKKFWDLGYGHDDDIHPTQEDIKQLCPDSNMCLMLGINVPLIKEYFNNFIFGTNFVKRALSDNGFFLTITYEKGGYITDCLLKSSIINDGFTGFEGDNLVYEYYIGKYFINDISLKFPCFLETYELCEYNSNRQLYNELKNNTDLTSGKTIDLTDIHFKDMSSPFDENIKASCEDPTKFSLLIQYVPNAIDVQQFVNKHKTTEIGNLFIFQILLQVFIPLSKLNKMYNFSHQDLHHQNVLIYTLPNDQYITIKYEFDDKIIEIKTCFIAKIIDYGRCHFNDYTSGGNTYGSNLFFNELIQKNECCPGANINEKTCRTTLNNAGYMFFKDDAPTPKNEYISIRSGNKSRDLDLPLRILSNLNNELTTPTFKNEFTEMFTNIIKNIKIIKDKYGYNYYLEQTNTENCPQNKICNVVMFEEKICECFMETYDRYIQPLENEIFQSKTLMGQLNVYVDNLTRNYEFIKV